MSTDEEILKELQTIKIFVGMMFFLVFLSVLVSLGTMGYGFYLASKLEKSLDQKIVAAEKPVTTEEKENPGEKARENSGEKPALKLKGDETLDELLSTHESLRDFNIYKHYDSHKAFAVTGFGAYGYVSERTTVDIAKDVALQTCESYRSSLEPACILVDVDGVFIPPSTQLNQK